jgi:acyl-CoA synthetase (AMP-forming)/AMP-acid ligase II
MLLLVPDISKFDLSSVRVVGSGAETMPDQTRNNVKQLFPNAGIWEVYGMTEAGGIITVRPENHTASKPFSVGQANLFEDVRVVDEQGNPVPPGEIGEIIVRGPHIMQGYYKDPARNHEALRDGWFYTQDLGRFDEDAFLYVIERKHNMIISGGENIYPKEVEDLLFRHPAVADAAVFGLPDSLWGHRVCAAIVAKKGAQLTEGDVIEFCKGKLAGYKKPRSVFFVESLPRNAVGKVLRSELKELFCNV